jgi:hypothetical protein
MAEKKEEIKPPSENLEQPELFKKFDFWGLGDFIAFLKSPTKIFFLNLLAGIGRGLGFAIGFTILTAIVILVLRRAVSVPVIGEYISKVLEFVESQRQSFH